TESNATDSKNVMAVPLVPPSRHYGNPSWLNSGVETHRPDAGVAAELRVIPWACVLNAAPETALAIRPFYKTIFLTCRFNQKANRFYNTRMESPLRTYLTGMSLMVAISFVLWMVPHH